MPARRSLRKRGSSIPRGRGRARKSARLAVTIVTKVEDVSSTNAASSSKGKSNPNTTSTPRHTRSRDTKNFTLSKSKEENEAVEEKNSADDFEDITSGNEFDSDEEIKPTKGKNISSALEDISDCSINGSDIEFEDISSAGSDNDFDFSSSKTFKIKPAIPHKKVIKSDLKEITDEKKIELLDKAQVEVIEEIKTKEDLLNSKEITGITTIPEEKIVLDQSNEKLQLENSNENIEISFDKDKAEICSELKTDELKEEETKAEIKSNDAETKIEEGINEVDLEEGRTFNSDYEDIEEGSDDVEILDENDVEILDEDDDEPEETISEIELDETVEDCEEENTPLNRNSGDEVENVSAVCNDDAASMAEENEHALLEGDDENVDPDLLEDDAELLDNEENPVDSVTDGNEEDAGADVVIVDKNVIEQKENKLEKEDIGTGNIVDGMEEIENGTVDEVEADDVEDLEAEHDVDCEEDFEDEPLNDIENKTLEEDVEESNSNLVLEDDEKVDEIEDSASGVLAKKSEIKAEDDASYTVIKKGIDNSEKFVKKAETSKIETSIPNDTDDKSNDSNREVTSNSDNRGKDITEKLMIEMDQKETSEILGETEKTDAIKVLCSLPNMETKIKTDQCNTTTDSKETILDETVSVKKRAISCKHGLKRKNSTNNSNAKKGCQIGEVDSNELKLESEITSVELKHPALNLISSPKESCKVQKDESKSTKSPVIKEKTNVGKTSKKEIQTSEVKEDEKLKNEQNTDIFQKGIPKKLSKDDTALALKHNVVLKDAFVKLEQVKVNVNSKGDLEIGESFAKTVDSKELEQIDFSDGWKIMDEAVGDIVGEKKDCEENKKLSFHKPFIRGIQLGEPAVSALGLFKDFKGPLVGLDYMVEVWKEDGRTPPKYFCSFCKILLEVDKLLNHLNGNHHKLEFMRVTSLDCWLQFPSVAFASWPKEYLKALDELCVSVAKTVNDPTRSMLITSHHWYTLRSRDVNERVRRMRHPSLPSKIFSPVFEKLAKVETIGDLRKKRISEKSKDKPSTENKKKPEVKTGDSTKSSDSKVKPQSKSSLSDKKGAASKVTKPSTNVCVTKISPSVTKKPNPSENKHSASAKNTKTNVKKVQEKSEEKTDEFKRKKLPAKSATTTTLKKKSPVRRNSPQSKNIDSRSSRSPRRSYSPRRRSPMSLRKSSPRPFRKLSPRRSPLRSRFSPRRSPLKSRYSPRRSPLRSRVSPRRSPLRSRFSPRRSPMRSRLSSRSPLRSRFSPRRSPQRSRFSPGRSPLRSRISPRRLSPRRSPFRRSSRSRSPQRRVSPRRSPLRTRGRSRSPISSGISSSRYNDIRKSPLRMNTSSRYRDKSPKNRRSRSSDRNFFNSSLPLPYTRQGNVVVVDEDLIKESNNSIPQILGQNLPQNQEYATRFNLFNAQSQVDLHSVKPVFNFPSTSTGSNADLFQRSAIFASSTKRKVASAFDSDLTLKRGRMDPYEPEIQGNNARKVLIPPEKKSENFWESWHKSHDEEEALLMENRTLQSDIWSKQDTWHGESNSPDKREMDYGRNLLERADNISVTVFNKSQKSDNLISVSQNDGVGYHDSNPPKPTADDIWRQQVELATSNRSNMSSLPRAASGLDWIQSNSFKEKQALQQALIGGSLSKKESFGNVVGSQLPSTSQNIANSGFGTSNQSSVSLSGFNDTEPLNIGGWSNISAARSAFEGNLGQIPLSDISGPSVSSWQNPERPGLSSGLTSALSRETSNPGQSSSRFGIVKTGTSSSVHPLAATAALSGNRVLEITGGNAHSSSDSAVRQLDNRSSRWNPVRSLSDGVSDNGNQLGRNLGTGNNRGNNVKIFSQDTWRSANISTSAIIPNQQSQNWRKQDTNIQQMPAKPNEDLNVVAQKLNSTLTRILNNYKPTGGLFSNTPGLQQRQDPGIFRPGPIGDKLSLAQNIASALTGMGMANVPQNELVAILQHLGLLGGGGQGMMPSGNRVMDDLRETVSRFERTFQYHRF